MLSISSLMYSKNKIHQMTTLLLILLALTALYGCHPRQRATFWMGKYNLEQNDLYSAESIPKLTEALKDTNRYIRLKALGVLGKFDNNIDTVVRLISDVAINDNNYAVRKDAAYQLANFDNQININALILLLRDGSYIVRLQAIDSLVKLGYTGNDFVDSLRILAEKDPFKSKNQYPVRAAAQKILSKMEFALLMEGKSLSEAGSLSGISDTSGINDIPNFYSVARQNDLAVIIGIEKYQNIKTKADYSRNDAALVKQYLLALGFQERNIEFLIDEKATGVSIRKTIEAWLPNHAKSDSRIFVYFSGHGSPDSSGAGYLVPYDGDPNYIKITGYPLNDLVNKLQQIKAQEVILVVDACFSGSGGKSVVSEGARPLMIEIITPEIKNKNIVFLASSRMNQISTSYKDKQQGLFTYFFIKSLQEGKLTIDDIYEYTKNRVEDEAKKMNIEQTPYLMKPRTNIKGDFSLR